MGKGWSPPSAPSLKGLDNTAVVHQSLVDQLINSQRLELGSYLHQRGWGCIKGSVVNGQLLAPDLRSTCFVSLLDCNLLLWQKGCKATGLSLLVRFFSVEIQNP